jgi:hypothetical protein
VCGSIERSAECVLTASTPDFRSLTTVRLFLHAARYQTSYLGVMQVPFIEGSERLLSREVSATVPPGSQPVGSAVSGQVTAKAGVYTFSITLDATQAGMPAPERIEERAPVTVK